MGETKPVEEKKPWPKWVRTLLLGVVGAALGACCPLFPPAVQGICVAVATVVSHVQIPEESSPAKTMEIGCETVGGCKDTQHQPDPNPLHL